MKKEITIMGKRIWIVIAICFAVLLLFLGAAILYQQNKRASFAGIALEQQEVFQRPHAIVYGDAKAKVHLIEFFDPECETCAAFYPYVKVLLSKFPGQVKLVLRYAPFHSNSRLVIKMLEAARLQGKYFETLEIFYRNHPLWADHHNPRVELLWTYLPQVGIDVDQLKKDMEKPEIKELIEQDVADGKILNVRKTPTFFVNGKPLEKFGYLELKALVKAEVDRVYQD